MFGGNDAKIIRVPRGVPSSTPSTPHYVVHNVNKFLIYLSTDFKRGGKLRKTKYLPGHVTLGQWDTQIKKLRSSRINSSNMKLSQIIQSHIQSPSPS